MIPADVTVQVLTQCRDHIIPVSYTHLDVYKRQSLRIERHVENTKKVVEFLANHPQVEKVNHPSLPDHPCLLYTSRCV